MTKLPHLAVAIAVSFATLPTAIAQNSHALENSHSSIFVPDSSIEQAGDHGIRAHTNHVIFLRGGGTPQATSPKGESPQTIYPVYYGAPFSTNGGSQTIAIVDAYDYPTAASDFNVFSNQFGLPTQCNGSSCLSVVYATGKKPRGNCGWNQEAALDIEWAHAMAPNAKIILVEAASSSFADLFTAVQKATSLVKTNGGKGEVSMSWGGSEFSSEASYDSYFQNSGVVYLASSGDTGGVSIYPSASPYVVATGGTTLNRSASGAFVSETGWSGSGGGASKYESIPSYQIGVSGASTSQRSIPDFSFDADPNTGVSVYDSTKCQGVSGWLVFGGTSVAAPSLAGVINTAASFVSGSTVELTNLYTNRTNANDFYDVLSGTAGSYSAKAGYDYVTGIGSSRGVGAK